MSTRSDDELFDPAVAAWLERAAGEVTVDLDAEWMRLVDRIQREALELAEIAPIAPSASKPPRVVGRGSGALLAVAVVLIALLVIAGPVFVRTTVTIVHLVRDVVEPATTATTTPPTTTPPTTTPPTTVVLPPVTTAPAAPSTTTDLAHAPILDGDAYRLTLRQVHDQLNAAIGFGRQDYAALEGADGLVEGLLGQRPEYDADLRDTIGHLRQAMRANDRRAASAAHTIIDRVQRETAGG